MTGKEIYDMIVKMNDEAKMQNGRLADLALPQDMYDTLLEWAVDFTYHNLRVAEDGSFYLDGVRIHTGEND